MRKRETGPYIIAEMGVNYYDTAHVMGITPLEAAKLYIDKAREAGVDCAKFQSYKAESIASRYSPSYWDTSKEPTRSQYELFKKFDHFGEDEYKELSKYTHSMGMDFSSTPFDYASADYLESLVDFYKISSSDITNLPFIRYIGSKGKKVMLSVGASYLSEIDEALRTLKNSGCKNIVLLHCVLSYPTDVCDANLRIIQTLKRVFSEEYIGYSDHVVPDQHMTALTTAYLMGAKVIEKHFTLDKTMSGNDHYHAGDPSDFKTAIDEFRLIDMLLGREEKTVIECERIPRREARRSLVVKRKLKAGQIIRNEDIAAKRPGTGISPKFLDEVIGRHVTKDIEEDTILTWNML